MNVVEVEDLHKIFKLPYDKNTSLKQTLLNFKPRHYERLPVLRGLNFEVKKGEFFGVVGRNGSGKSTLLKILAGIYEPTTGKVKVNGQLTPFIELGVGFNPELTGRDNVYLNGAIFGLTTKQIDRLYDEIVSFAELEKFMDQKLKNYSSGMQVRLAFSIAIRAHSEILLIDEVLAVGDAAFQQKCYDYFDQLRKSDKTVIFISHDLGAVQSFCDRAILIEDGQIKSAGKPVEVTGEYSKQLAADAERKFENTSLIHVGVGGAELLGSEIIGQDGKSKKKLEEGEAFTIRVHFKANDSVKDCVLGVGIMGEKGQSIMGPNTKESQFKVEALPKKGYFEAKFKVNLLSPGYYRLRAGIFNTSNTIAFDFVEHLNEFYVIGQKRHGDIYVDPDWSIQDEAGA